VYNTVYYNKQNNYLKKVIKKKLRKWLPCGEEKLIRLKIILNIIK